MCVCVCVCANEPVCVCACAGAHATPRSTWQTSIPTSQACPHSLGG